MAASGKLTIARELEKLTGLGVFHNHLVVDALPGLVEKGHGTKRQGGRSGRWTKGLKPSVPAKVSTCFTRDWNLQSVG